MCRGQGCLIICLLYPVCTHCILTETLYTWLAEQQTHLENITTITNIEGVLTFSQSGVGEKDQIMHIIDMFTYQPIVLVTHSYVRTARYNVLDQQIFPFNRSYRYVA